MRVLLNETEIAHAIGTYVAENYGRGGKVTVSLEAKPSLFGSATFVALVTAEDPEDEENDR